MMIEVVVRTYPAYESEDIVRNGHDYKGTQKYHCHACGTYGTLDKNDYPNSSAGFLFSYCPARRNGEFQQQNSTILPCFVQQNHDFAYAN